jgi:hypothetical protein
VDVGPFVVADAQTAELIQPGERPLDDPAPPPQAAAVLGATHRQQRQNMTCAQAAPDRCRIIAAVAEHADRPAARSAVSTLQGRNGIDEGQGFLRVISIRAGQADRKWDALAITDQMAFAPAFGAIGGIRTCLRAATDGPHRATVNDGTRPINVAVARQPAQKREVHQIPDAFLLPIAQASPTGHPRSAPQLLRQHLPRNPAAQHEENAGEAQSGMRGRPPFGRGGEAGRSGSMRSHSASGNSTAAINRRR